jgi:hypothetical protein
MEIGSGCLLCYGENREVDGGLTDSVDGEYHGLY